MMMLYCPPSCEYNSDKKEYILSNRQCTRIEMNIGRIVKQVDSKLF